ncbi:MAG: hypothetical protein JWM80_6470 [Cyanobacteria bacterium RYN_339]|nr:hypothetical protein [Cyanobacteria bacterium RYN_339]
MNIQGIGQHGHKHGGGIEGFISKLKDDTSDEATGIKNSYQKLKDDIKAGATQETLTADRSALTDAMKTFREKNPPPARPEHDAQGFLAKLAEKVSSDQSTEGTQLAAAIKKLQGDSAGVDADKQSFMDALKAYFEKQRGQSAGDDATASGQNVDCRA